MILSDRDIRVALADNRLRIDNMYNIDAQIQPCGVDVCLSRDTVRFKEASYNEYIDVTRNNTDEQYREIFEWLVIKPHEFMLGSSIEYLRIPPNMVGILAGRSSIARYGLDIHKTAGILEPGWEGNITFELFNNNHRTLIIPAGTRVGQVMFMQLTSRAVKPYDLTRKYQQQVGPTISKLNEDFPTTITFDHDSDMGIKVGPPLGVD